MSEGMVCGRAPIPGTIVAVEVKAEAQVKAGDAILVIESMKMEHEIVAECDAILHRMFVQVVITVTEERHSSFSKKRKLKESRTKAVKCR